MKNKNKNTTDHCCQMMAFFTEDKRIGIRYNPKTRSYYIDLIDGPAKQNISYCPFCSKKLPTCLREKYYVILNKKYNIEDLYDREKLEKLIPEEFKSDAWWKKRNL